MLDLILHNFPNGIKATGVQCTALNSISVHARFSCTLIMIHHYSIYNGLFGVLRNNTARANNIEYYQIM